LAQEKTTGLTLEDAVRLAPRIDRVAFSRLAVSATVQTATSPAVGASAVRSNAYQRLTPAVVRPNSATARRSTPRLQGWTHALSGVARERSEVEKEVAEALDKVAVFLNGA
jgi:hypothetical protein